MRIAKRRSGSGNWKTVNDALYEYPAEIIRVIDGDTVEARIDLGFHTFAVQKLRLWGINAPEKRGASRESGLESASHLETLIASDQPIRVQTRKDKQGKYGRYLATLLGGSGVNINQRMVYHGYAVSVEDR